MIESTGRALLLLMAAGSAACTQAAPGTKAPAPETRKVTVMKELAPGLLVAPQISEADVEAAAAAGVRTIIMNRPDGEELGQPTSAALRAAAEARGMAFHHIPVSGGQFTPEAVSRMQAAIDGSDGSTLAFCRSGSRSASLWALGRAGREPADAIIAAGARAGYDLTPLRARLAEPGLPAR